MQVQRVCEWRGDLQQCDCRRSEERGELDPVLQTPLTTATAERELDKKRQSQTSKHFLPDQ